MQSKTGAVMRLLLIDIVGSVAWFPLWWYTLGLSHVAGHFLQSLRYRAQSYSLRIWMRNFFVPMYGQHDITGRLVSVFMRFVVLVGRVFALVFEAVFYLVLLAAWVAAPALFIALAANGLIRGALVSGARSAL